MKYRVTKEYYCPIEMVRKLPGDVVEILDKHLKGYLPYVQVIELATIEPAEKAVIAKPKKRPKKAGG